MNSVEPIRDIDTIRDISKYLKNKSERDYIMFVTGIYSGLRISDILKLRVRDVKNKSCITLREKKTSKQKTFQINPYLKKALSEYIINNDLDMDSYLIRRQGRANKPIKRDRAYKIMQHIAKHFGLINVGTHTLRKTFGYHFYMQTKDIVTLQLIFNHADPSITLRYIGIEQDTINEKINSFKLL